MLVNSLINIFLINPNIILYHAFQDLYSTEKSYRHPFNHVFFMVLTEKSPEIFPQHKAYFFLFQNLLLRIDIWL